jgi:hypothetical protein
MKNIEISPKEYERHLNWDDAMMYCQLLTINGKDDWRLPTKDELKYIYKSKKDFTGYYYWTSTEDTEDTEDSNNNYAWTFNSWDRQNWYDKRNKFYVRAVRNLKK